MVPLESIGDKMEDERWWPKRKDWPEFPEEEIHTGSGETFKHRLCEDQAMALLMLEEYVIMLNADGKCGLFVNCSDTFYYACADAEPIPPVGFGDDKVFWELYDLVRLYGGIGSVKWCAIRRNTRPLRKYLDLIRDEGLWCERMEALSEGDMD